MSDAGYTRFPSLHPYDDAVVFVCEDDLWTVSLNGGQARRLTAGAGAISHPCYSPDGLWIAFSSTEEGSREVYVMPAAGGPPRRLTWLGEEALVVGWTPDSASVVCASAAGQMSARMHCLLAVPVAGGQPRPLPWGPARGVAFGPRGAVALARYQDDLARWKRYRGGRAGEVWVDPDGSGNFRRLVETSSNQAAPMWLGDRIAFLSDHEGVGALYVASPRGGRLERLTPLSEFYARWPSTDGRRIVYQQAARLMLWSPGEPEPRPLRFRLHGPRPQETGRFVDARGYLEDFALHPDGRALALTVRGQAVVMGCWEGPSARLGGASGVRQRLARYLADGERLALVSDAGGEEAVELHRAEGGPPLRRWDDPRLGRIIELCPAPSGVTVAYANHRHEVGTLNMETGELRVLGRSAHGRVEGLSWSADAAWLVYSSPTTRETASILLHELATGRVTAVTDGLYRDVQPTFDPEGRYLYFLSYREFNPVYDALYFDLAFPRGTRPYLVTLQRDLRSPFEPEPAPLHPPEERARPAPGPLVVHTEGIQDRIVPFPLPEGRYVRIHALPGRLLLTELPVEGSLSQRGGDGGAERGRATLLSYDLDRQVSEPVAKEVNDFTVDLGNRTLAWRSGGKLRVVRARKSAERDEPSSETPGRATGWVDLSRASVRVEPRAEWAQMFREAWRLMREHFWREDMSGVDWSAAYARYRPLVDRVASRSEFSDLLWELQGELGTSHAYEIGGDYRAAPSWKIGKLGADFTWDDRAGGYRVVALPQGEPGDPARRSPLAAPGVDLRVGAVLLAVDGAPLRQNTPVGASLAHRAGREVRLLVQERDDAAPRSVVVRTLTDDRPLRYRAKVRADRARVHRETADRVGYVHIPDMGPEGYAEFHRDYLIESRREALVVDVRHNRGGHVSQLLLEKLARRRLGFSASRWGRPEPWPQGSGHGPMVAITNAFAGSDGDIFSHAFKLLKLGPLIGTRTWGGVVGIWPRHALVDGTITTQPEFSMWFNDVGFGVENHGTEPDELVEITPSDEAQGRDPQLEAAIRTALALLQDTASG